MARDYTPHRFSPKRQSNSGGFPQTVVRRSVEVTQHKIKEVAMQQLFILFLGSILLSGSLFAQTSARRLFVGIDGPVKSVRLEVAKLTPGGDSIVEGPRILYSTDEANEDGTLTISRRYRPD